MTILFAKLAKSNGCCGMVWGLGVTILAVSLFHDEKFAFFDFGNRGTTKILKIILGVPRKFLKKVGVMPAATKGFWPRREAAEVSFKILGLPLIPKVITIRVYSTEWPPIHTNGQHYNIISPMVQWLTRMI